MQVKTDCFAYAVKDGKETCRALKKLDCEGCKYYKTVEQLEYEQRKCENRNTAKSGNKKEQSKDCNGR